jgi:hypothetical protein
VTAWASVSWHSGSPTNSHACIAATASGSACGSALPTSSLARITSRRQGTARPRPPSSIRASQYSARVGIAAADALDQRAGGVVVLVAGGVVLIALRCTDSAANSRVNSRPLVAGQHADLQAESARRASPSLTSARNSRASSCITDSVPPQPRRRSASARRRSVLMSSATAAELKDLAAADQRAVDGEERVFGGRADERHHALFHVGQQHVLLGLVEAVDLVDEQQRLAAAGPAGRGPLRAPRAVPSRRW